MNVQSLLILNAAYLNNYETAEVRYLEPGEKLPNIDNLQSQVPISDRLLLNIREAADMLSMTDQALRDLIHKGQGPEVVKRGTRTCFTHAGLKAYVSELPTEHPSQTMTDTVLSRKSNPPSIEEKRALGIA